MAYNLLGVSECPLRAKHVCTYLFGQFNELVDRPRAERSNRDTLAKPIIPVVRDLCRVR